MLPLSLSEFADKISEIMPVVIQELTRRQTNELFRGKITLVQFIMLDFLHKRVNPKMKDFINLELSSNIASILKA
jgi:hypothetical protein